MQSRHYSSLEETKRILRLLQYIATDLSLPAEIVEISRNVQFSVTTDSPCFPIPFKETETAAALKAIEGSVASALAKFRYGLSASPGVHVDLEKATAFLFQAYLATVGGLGKLDKEVKSLLKDTDLHQAQSNIYRRMSANLYATKRPGEYYHIHGSLDASTTLKMIGLKPFEPELQDHESVVQAIEPAVQRYTIEELEHLNNRHRQAGVPALQHDQFLQTDHGQIISKIPPWCVRQLESETPKCPFSQSDNKRILSGIKVLELCRIIAGPVITRILAEYGADVLKITSPSLSDVPFFQVDGNMGKHAAELDLKTPAGRRIFEELLAEADVFVDGYRPGALAKLGYGQEQLVRLAKTRGKGIVYVQENCFGYQGEWASRPGWQQIADCVSGIAWEQGRFMGLDEPVVPPFPISDYGTGCMGAIAALTGLYHRATKGGSWLGQVSLLQYDILLFKVGLLPDHVQEALRSQAGEDFLALRHSHSVDQISGTALRRLKQVLPDLFATPDLCETRYSQAYKAEVSAVRPVVEIDGFDIGFRRASRPNGSDQPDWNFDDEEPLLAR